MPATRLTLRESLAHTFHDSWVRRAYQRVRHLRRLLTRRADGERFLLHRYQHIHGKPLADTPTTFTEKLFHRMLALNRQDNPTFTALSDKFAARAIVASRVGASHLVPLLWHGTDPHAIPFDTLPQAYVLKPNHGSGQVLVVRGAPDRGALVRTLDEWLRSNYYWASREYQYYHIPPRVLVEAYLTSPDGLGPLDYRFWCFHGVPEVIQVDNHAHDINPFFDTQWTPIDLFYRAGAARPSLAPPPHLAHMLALAGQLAEGLDFVRVDLYNVEGHIYFGEFTLTPTGGALTLPEQWDVRLGRKW